MIVSGTEVVWLWRTLYVTIDLNVQDCALNYQVDAPVLRIKLGDHIYLAMCSNELPMLITLSECT